MGAVAPHAHCHSPHVETNLVPSMLVRSLLRLMGKATFIFISLLLGLAWARADEVFQFTPHANVHVLHAAGTADGKTFVVGATDRPARLPGALRRFHGGGSSYHGFVTQLNAQGHGLVSAVFGGQDTWAAQVVVAPGGDVVVIGSTSATNFPVVRARQATNAGAQDAFIIRFDATLRTIRFATYLGTPGQDTAIAVAVDAEGNSFVVLQAGAAGLLGTNAFDFGAPTEASHPVLVKLSPSGELLYASRLHSFSSLFISSLAVDGNGHAHVAGLTANGVLPTVNAPQPWPSGSGADAFVAKFTRDGRATLFATYLAGAGNDDARAIAVNAAGDIFVGGQTSSENFPDDTDDAPPFTPNSRAFVARYSPSGAWLGVQTLTASGRDIVESLALDGAGRVLVGGTMGARFDKGRSFVARLTGGEPILPQYVGKDASLAAVLGSVSTSGEDVVLVSASSSFSYSGVRSVVMKVTLSSAAPWPPTVALLSPAPGSIVAPGQGITLSAAAFGGTGGVAAVSFYDGGTLIAVVTNAPYWLVWSNTQAGPHLLTARALVSGVNVTSAPVTVTLGSPVNDQFDNRTRLRGERVNVRGSVRGATAEDSTGYSPNFVWWEWVAPRSGVFQISIAPNGQGFYLELYTGQTLEVLQRSASGYEGELTFRAQRGTAYQIGLANYSTTTPEDFRLRLRPVAAPKNDLQTRPHTLSGLPASASGTLRYATADVAIYSGYGRDVWYEWTAPVAGSYLASVESAETLPYVNVIRGQLPDSYSSIGQDVNGATNGQAFTARAGEKLLVRVFDYSSSPNFTLHLRAQPALVNDELFNALELPASGVIEGHTIGATWSSGEPGQFYYDQFAWWKWTAPSSGVFRARFQLTPRASTTTSLLRQLRPSSRYGAVQVFAGDVWTGLTQVADWYGEDGGAFRAVAGETYAVAVNGGFAHFTLGLEAVAPPANDNFADAEILTGTNLAVSARLAYATREPGEPGSGAIFPFGFDGSSVWYRWTAPEEGAYAFSVSPQARLVLYLGEELVSLQPITHSFTSQHTIRVAAGETLWIAVTQPHYSLLNTATLRLQKVTPPANDDFAQREILTGAPVSFVPRTRHATLQTNEPYATPGLLRTPATVWYEWAAPYEGDFTLASQSGGSSGYWTLWRIQGGFPEQTETSRFSATAGEVFHLMFYDYGYGSAAEPFGLQPASVPVNDHFAQSLVLTGAVVSVNGTMVGATREALEPESTGENTVWYSWAAPRTGQLLVELGDDNHSPGLRAFTGTELAGLEPRPENEIFSRSAEHYNLAVEAGMTYHLAINSNESFTSEGAFHLTLRFAERPANDDFAQRARVFGSRARGTTKGATYEFGEGDGPTVFSGSTWWTWTAPRTGQYQIEVTSGFPIRDFGVYAGTNRDELEVVLDDSPELGLGVWRFHATRGTAYAVQIGTGEPGGSDYEFTITTVRPPANDHFTNAAPLHGSRLLARGSARYASVEEEERFVLGTVGGRSIWWRWTAPVDGMVFLQLEDGWQGAGIYQGTNWNDLLEVTYPGGRIEAAVQAGVEYHLRVHLWAETPPGHEAVKLSLRHERAPANDRFENRITLAGTNVTTTGTLLGATALDEPPVIEYGQHTVWWRWVAPTAGRYTITVRAQNFSPYHQIFLGDRRDELIEPPVGWAVFGLKMSQFNLPLEAGQAVAIAVDTDESPLPAGEIELSIHPTVAPVNDDFSQRLDLVDGRGESTTEGSSRELGEPGAEEETSRGTLWWHFTAESNGWHLLTARLTVDRSPYVGLPVSLPIQVFTGKELENLVPVDGVPDRFPGAQPQRVLLMAGVEYALQVHNAPRRLGRVGVTAQFQPAPANDHFTNALVRSGDSWSVTSENAWATAELDEPVYAEGSNSVWWRWTALVGGQFQVFIESQFAGVLRVHSGAELGTLTEAVGTSFAWPYWHPQGSFSAEAGETFHLSYRSAYHSEGPVRLGLRRADPPANDHFSNRLALAGSPVSVTASNFFATAEAGDPFENWFGYTNSVWWKWTAPGSGPVTVSMSGVTGGGVIAGFLTGIYRGGSLATLTNVSRPYVAPFSFSAVAGAEYVIVVAGQNDYQTQFTFTLAQDEESAAAPLRNAPRVLWLETGGGRVIETSTNLTDWTLWRTNTTATSLSLPVGNEAQRFFRVR